MGQKHAFGVLPPQRPNGPMRYIVSSEASRRDASTEPHYSLARAFPAEQSAKRWAGSGPLRFADRRGLSRRIHMPGRNQKLETQHQKEDQITTLHPPDNAESEVFSDSRRFFHDFFLEKMILYGEVTIKSRWLEAKPLKFSPPKSLCGTVGSPWVSLATLFGFWETLIKFSESMILVKL